MAYKERARHVPSPLNLTPRSPPPLLYDLPSESPSTSSNTVAFSPKSPRSPPRTPRGRPIGLKSPTAPNFASNLSSGLKNVNTNSATLATYGLHHPQPLNSSNQVYGLPTPSRSAAGTPTQEMDSFGALCRAWYFQQDAKAGTQIQEILRTLPPAQRATYTRLQSQIRSSYHTAVALRRDSEFNAHITSTRPGASLTLLHRQTPTSNGAKLERLERLQRFVNVWCTSGNVGTRPFFEGLFAVLRLQGLLQELGGAGPRRMEWEIDDAVFKESAGKEFMLEAVDVLKGVLGFDESLPGQSRGDLSPSSETAVDEPLEPPPPIHDQASPPVSPRRKPPPPLPPSRRHLDENRKSRPSLPTIVSGTVIDRQRGLGRTATGDDGTIEPFSPPTPNEELQVVLGDDIDEGDTFADPHPSHSYGHSRRTSSPSSPRTRPAVPPRKKKLGSQSSSGAGEDIVNRTRSHSDPFDDTHGHLVYGHGHSRKATQGSIGAAPGVSPSLRPLLVPGNPNEGGSSISTGTTGESVLSTVGKTGVGITSSGSALKKTVPLPPEDFELDETRPRHAGTDPPNPAENLESDEEEGPFGEDQEFDGKKNAGFGMHFGGGKRRGSESTGLGLLGTGHGIGHHAVKGYSVDNSSTKLHSTSRSQSERGMSRISKPVHATSLSNPTTLSNPVTLSRPTTPDASLMLTSSVFATGGMIGAEQHLRTWVVPVYLSNPEIAKLLDVFPSSITRGSIPRFRSAVQGDKGKKKKKTKGTGTVDVDLEAGPTTQEREYVRHGTGRMWIGDVVREEGWRGSMWDRFVGWWRRVFC